MTSPSTSPQAGIVGRLDTVTPKMVAGWAAVQGEMRPLEIEILLDGKPVGTCRANRPRPDLARRGDVHPNAGFELRTDLSAAAYTSRVTARVAGVAGDLSASGRFVQPLAGPRLFFIHIPKTAGSTINTIARLLCPRMQDHIENGDWRDAEFYSGHNFLSGHLSSRLPVELYRPHGYRFFTMVRQPAEQFVSHLRWLRHYAKMPMEEARRLIDPLNLEIAHALDAAPAALGSQVACLRDLLQNPKLGPAVRPLFDNSLTRYMVTIGAARMTDQADAAQALQALDDFEMVGLQSEFAESLVLLERLSGLDWTAHAGRWDNSSPDTEVRGESSVAAGLAQEFIWSDMELYREAVTRFRRARLGALRSLPLAASA
jgi:hypothetical protein